MSTKQRVTRIAPRSTRLAAALIAAMGLLAGNTIAKEQSQDPATESRHAARATIYSLSQKRSVIGLALENRGWAIQASSLDLIPNEKNTVLYLNAEDYVNGDRRIQAFLTNFRGVLIVDSNRIWPSATADDQQMKSAPVADSLTTDNSARSYLKLTEELPGPMGSLAPEGTAVIASMNERSFFTVDVRDDGTFNGVELQDLEMVFNLEALVRSNAEAPDAYAKNWNSDVFIKVSEVRDGYYAVAHLFADGKRTGNGIWTVETKVVTGDKENVCLVNDIKCGIYPVSKAKVFKSSRATNGTVSTIGWITKHGAIVYGLGAIDTLAYRPGKAMWGEADKRDSDSYEVKYTESAWTQLTWSPSTLFTLAATAQYGVATTHRKTMQSWDGWDGNSTSTYNNGNGVLRTRRVTESGVELKPEFKKIFRGFLGGNWVNADQFSDLIASKLFDSHTDMCRASGKTTKKPKMAWEGWQPSITTVHQFPPNYQSYPVAGNYIVVNAGLKWSRQKLSFTWSAAPTWTGNLVCGGTNYQRDRWMHTGGSTVISDLITPPDGEQNYEVIKGLMIPHNLFTP